MLGASGPHATGVSPRKLAVKPVVHRPGPTTIMTARRTFFPPNSPHGTGMSDNVQIGCRLRKGIKNPQSVMEDKWSTSCLQETIRIAAPRECARACSPPTRLIHKLFASRCGSYIKSEGFTYTKTGSVEQFDNCKEDVLEIPDVGEVMYTPEYHIHRAFLAAKPKPVLNMDVRTALEHRARTDICAL